jgi:hypothetical protein
VQYYCHLICHYNCNCKSQLTALIGTSNILTGHASCRPYAWYITFTKYVSFVIAEISRLYPVQQNTLTAPTPSPHQRGTENLGLLITYPEPDEGMESSVAAAGLGKMARSV